MRLLLYLLLGCAAGDWSSLVWETPTAEPGLNFEKKPIVSGGMPLGNGETGALVFPVTKAFNTTPDFELPEGVHIYLSMQTAMASDMALFPLGVVSIETEPNLGVEGFKQSLLFEKGVVEVSTNVGTVTVWVDRKASRVVANVRGAHGTEIAAKVTMKTLRPNARFTYFGRCSAPSSAPDVWGRPAGPDSVGLSHRNVDEDEAFMHAPAAFNTTLRQQGMENFTERLQHMDKWRNRQFGMVVSGEGLVGDAKAKDRLVSSGKRAGFDVVITTWAEQTQSSEEWEKSIGTLHRTHRSDDIDKAREVHEALWKMFWDESHLWVTGSDKSDKSLQALTERYAQTRYLQAIQAGTWVPIKYNGMIFLGQLPPEGRNFGPSYRVWGSCNWWQNTRLAYWNMLASGDFGSMRTIFDYFSQMLDYLNARTQAAFNHTGIYITETATLFGAYDPCDYGTDARDRKPTDLPFGYQYNAYIRFDFGGDGGLTELCTMLLDYYMYTLDEAALKQYMPLLTGTLDFFSKHYGDVTKMKKLTIFPTQGLETYQCPSWPATPDKCPTNDHPTIAALHVLTERALELPETVCTEEQRAQWRALQAALPPVPLVVENGVTVVSPYETYPKAQRIRNSETPELYSTHPFRYFTLGRSLLQGERKRDIAPSIHCLEKSKRRTCRNADANVGWTQGLMNAALLGRAKLAAKQTLNRAIQPPAQGYRFPAFAKHYQDYQPSEDHWANMNIALQFMLLSPADDGLESAGALLFPAWPCEWDVDFKLAAPRQTTVSGRFAGGRLQELVVEPESRRGAIKVLACQNISAEEGHELVI